MGLFTKDQENALWQLDGGLGAARTTFVSRCSDREEKKPTIMHILEEMQLLHEKIRAAKVDSVVHRLMLLMESLKELAARLRLVLSVKRQLEDVPSQSELIQYERCFSELNMNIVEIHRQTRKYYATYNTLLEIKELMLKETSLLNSLNAQFQDAISDTAGCLKLMDSMEGILKGIKQKLEKVQDGIQADQRFCNALREKYAAAAASQRRGSSLLKALQEEITRNQRLKSELLSRNAAPLCEAEAIGSS